MTRGYGVLHNNNWTAMPCTLCLLCTSCFFQMQLALLCHIFSYFGFVFVAYDTNNLAGCNINFLQLQAKSDYIRHKAS